METRYLQFRAADFLSRTLPLRLSYWIGLRMADQLFRRDAVARRAVMRNLRRILEFQGQKPSEERLKSLARCVFQHFGKYLVDFFRFAQLSRDEALKVVTVEHHEYLEQGLAMDRGALLVTAHLGGWEVGGAALVAMGYPMNVVVLPQADRRVNELFQSRRQGRGMRVIPLGQAARGTLAALKARQLVALLADRDYSGHNHPVPFFGAPARLPSGPARLCVKTGAPIVPGFLLRLEDDSFLLRIHPPIVPDGREVGEVQERICAILQQEVAARPTQWFMFGDFWCSDENGKQGWPA